MARILEALDMEPRELAKTIGERTRDIKEMCEGGVTRSGFAQVDEEPVMNKTLQYVDERIGKLMAVRYELQTKLHQDRKQRIARLDRIAGR